MTWELSFNNSDLWELCERFATSTKEGKTFEEQTEHVYKAINYAAQSIGRFDLQVKRGTYYDGLPGRVFTLVKLVNTCSVGGHEIYLSSDGFYSIRWNEYGM